MSAGLIRTQFSEPKPASRTIGARDSGRAANGFPTIIVASKDAGVRSGLLRDLVRAAAPLVLEADSEAAILDFVKLHSRPVHVLLVDSTLSQPEFVANLRQYRREMNVVLVAEYGPSAAVAKARKLLAR